MTKNDAVERALKPTKQDFVDANVALKRILDAETIEQQKPLYEILYRVLNDAEQALQTSRPDAGENPFSVDGTLARYAAKETVFNGIEKWARVVHLDAPSNFGTVMHCGSDGAVVRWDDGKIGELSWNDAVAYSAYRLQTVIRAALKSGDKGREAVVWRKVSDQHPAKRAKYFVIRGDKYFTATVCFGMHMPWWVPRDGYLDKESAPIDMLPDDLWMPTILPPTSEGV